MNPGHVTAALPPTNQLQESHEATLGGIWGRREMIDPSLVWPHSKGEALLYILHCHSSGPGKNSGKERVDRKRWRGTESGREETERERRGKKEREEMNVELRVSIILLTGAKNSSP